MLPFSFSFIRIVMSVATLCVLLGAPFPLAAETAEPGVVIAGPAPSVSVPEPVTIRAEPQPQAPPPLERRSSASRLGVRSVLTMLADPDGSLDQKTAAASLSRFVPFAVDVLSRSPGVLWLHLDLADVKDAAPHTLWLDLGSQIPSGVSVWLSPDGRDFEQVGAGFSGLYDLLPAGERGQVLIRMDGLPGLWFRPALCSPSAVVTSPERLGHMLCLAALAVLGALSLLLSVTERSEGRFWTGVLALAALTQILWGVPSMPSGHVGTGAFPGMFAAGVALFMLPHAGRVVMRTRETSPFVDTLFLLFALPGACAAIVPLLPGMAWTVRLLPLWPLAALLCLVPSVVLLFRGVRGSGSFTLSCLFMGGGAVVSLWGRVHGLESPWWGLAVQAGQAAGVLLLSSAAPRRAEDEVPAKEPALDIAPRRPVENRTNTYRDNSLAALRRAFRGTVEELFEEACRLDLALSRAGVDKDKVDIMTHADGMVAAARRLSESALDLPAEATLPDASLQVFELRQVIQKAFASVFDEAGSKGLGLAWYVAPQLGQKFKGDAARLTALLSLLLADAVRASSRGAVSLHVRRSGASTHPGHLQFTVIDNGEGLPPRGRQSMLLSRAWELACANGGDFFMDSTPQGMELSFSMECTAMEPDGVTERVLPSSDATAEGRDALVPVILASADALNRQMYAHYLSDMGLSLWEARDAEEAAALYASSPAALVIFDGSLREEDMVQGLAAIRMFEGEQALAAAPFLLLARDDMQAGRMAKAGCDESLLLPVVRRDLRALTRWLISPSGPRPVLSSQRITLAAVLAGAHSGTARMQSKAARRAAAQESAETAAVRADEASGAPEQTEGNALSLQADASADAGKKERGWLSSLFRPHEKTGRPLEVAQTEPRIAEGERGQSIPSGPGTAPEETASSEVVELLSEQVLVEESGVQELTQDRIVSGDGEHAGDENGQEPLELDASFIHEEETVVLQAERSSSEEAAPSEEEPPSGESSEGSALAASDGGDDEEMELPLGRMTDGVNGIAEALIRGDVPAIRRGARELSAIADRYGMHTLADMARCFRAAWEEGDVEAAAQIVEEMRSEIARL